MYDILIYDPKNRNNEIEYRSNSEVLETYASSNRYVQQDNKMLATENKNSHTFPKSYDCR